jgi:dihydroorotate dehydrogenase (NAD+) catalytic subunit
VQSLLQGHNPAFRLYALTTEFLGKKVSGQFTVPSGIVTTATSIIQNIFDQLPQIGVVTTKSVGLEPRLGNREPVYSQYAPGCFVNAVGLTNPGATAAASMMAELKIPEDRFLLTSIFGGSVDEFVAVAKIMAPVSDGLELNLSCPHASGYGMAMGQDPQLVRQITAAVKAAVDIPVVPKLTPNTPNIAEIALAAMEGGADALCAINTLGPGYTAAQGHAVLSNGAGGMSGKGCTAYSAEMYPRDPRSLRSANHWLRWSQQCCRCAPGYRVRRQYCRHRIGADRHDYR